MKTALLISGLPRHIDQGFSNVVQRLGLGIHDALIKPNSPDVFIHTWADPNDEALKSKLINLFHPSYMLIEPPRIIQNTHMNLDRMMASHGRSYKRDKFVEMVYSMWYSIQQANLLKEICRLKHNIHYDYVIRARFDITYTMAVDVKNYDKNIIHTAHRPDLPPEMVDDRFAFASNELMNVYCSGFNLIEHVFAERDKLDGIFCGETILYEMFKTFGIQHTHIPGLHANHLNHG